MAGAEHEPVGVSECFRFPVATAAGRRDVVVGGALLLVPLVGWILNLGHRLDVVWRLAHADEPYFRGFSRWRRTFVRGLRAFCAICVYLGPAAILAAAAWPIRGTAASIALGAAASAALALAVFSLPGGMTYNAAHDDMRYLYRPDLAFRRAVGGGRQYLRSWGIALAAIALSLPGLLALGVGFLFTSVWAWSVVGYAFSRALVVPDPPGAGSVRAPDPAGGAPDPAARARIHHRHRRSPTGGGEFALSGRAGRSGRHGVIAENSGR